MTVFDPLSDPPATVALTPHLQHAPATARNRERERAASKAKGELGTVVLRHCNRKILRKQSVDVPTWMATPTNRRVQFAKRQFNKLQ